MRIPCRFGVALAAAVMIGIATPAQVQALRVAGPPQPNQLAAQADIIVIGKIVEIEKDTVEAGPPYAGAEKDLKMTYKIAVLKIEETILGGKGLTQFRVGFPSDAAAAGEPVPPNVPRPAIRPIRPGFGPVALTAGQEGCFFLSSHPTADFYILGEGGRGGPLNKKDENYAKQLEEVKKIGKIIDSPVDALKAKDLNDRFKAAQMVLQRYQMNRSGKPSPTREAIPAEENKLIVALLAELPWQPKFDGPRTGSTPVPPSRQGLWYMVQQDMVGFVQPKYTPPKKGEPKVDFNKVMDDATAAYLKANADKIKLKRFAK
jgi:hypothetical protein